MAKDKSKVNVVGGAKKWAVWKTVLVVISSVLFVAGATILGIYLAGGLKNPVIYPQDISFVKDEKLFNNDNNQFEVTEDFQMVINSSTAEVTEKEVTLSFPGSTSTNPANNTISDGIITVPKTVTLGQPFTVQLNKKHYDGISEDWIAGGISTLIATSSNDQILGTSTQIAVDVPVYSFEVVLTDENGKEIDNVTELEKFFVKANFLPAESEYLYSDDNAKATVAEKRKRAVYFEERNAQNVSFNYNDGNPYFEASSLSTKNDFEIVGYTFIHADDQIKTLNEMSQLYQGEQLYKNIISTLHNNEQVASEGVGSFEIVQASISSFRVQNTSISLTSGMTSRIAVNTTELANASLGATITSTDGERLEGMLRNIAIRFTYKKNDQIQEAYDILQFITDEENIITIDGKKYIKANSDVLDYNYCYWDVTPKEACTITMEVVLLMADPESEAGYKFFENSQGAVVNQVTLTVKQNQEKQLSWKDNSDIQIALSYSGGQIVPRPYSLSGMGVVPADNAYQTVVYFACFDDSLSKPEEVLSNWQTARAGEYLVGADTRTLLPFESDSFTVIGTGEFKLYFATIRTINGTIIYNEDGTYQLVQVVSEPINVKVSKSLHEGSVTGASMTLEGASLEQDGGVYINEGSTTQLKLTFSIDVDSVETFREVVEQNLLSLRLLDSNGNDITDKFTIVGGKGQYSEDGLTLTYILSVNGSLGLGNNAVQLKKAKLSENLSGFEWELDVNCTVNDNPRNVYIYSPAVQSIDLSATGFNINSSVVVEQSLQGDGDFVTTLTQDGQLVANGIDEFVQKLKVVVTDQFGSQSTLTNWSFATDNTQVITISSDGKSFSFQNTNEKTIDCKIWIRYPNFDNVSNNTLMLKITSTGVQYIRYDNNSVVKPADASAYTPEWVDANDLSQINLSKFGAKGRTITFADIVELYVQQPDDEGILQGKYTGGSFRFDINELSSMSDEDILSLFAYNTGMLSLGLKASETFTPDWTQVEIAQGDSVVITEGLSASQIRTLLAYSNVESLTFNYNFGTSQILKFNIVGGNGAVNIDLNLEIRSNISFSGDNAVNNDASTEIKFENYSISDETIKSEGSGQQTKKLTEYLASLAKNGYKYIVPDMLGNGYYISNSSDNNVASISDNGYVTFNDFWDEEVKTFALNIYLDGESVTNKFAPSVVVTFNINRNIVVSWNEGMQYQILTTEYIENLVNVERKTGDNELNGIVYRFDENAPFTINEQNQIERKDTLFFDYNEKVKTCKLTILVNNTEIETIDFVYSLGDDFNYSNIASGFTKDGEVAEIQSVINEEENIEYLYVTSGYWNFEKTISGYSVSLRSMFTDSSIDSDNPLYFQANQNYEISYNDVAFLNPNNLLLGLNNKTVFALFEVTSSNNVAVAMVMPLIISNNGMVFGNYNNGVTSKELTLQNLLTTPDELIEQGIYTVVEAGQEVEVLKPISDIAGNNSNAVYYIPNGEKLSAKIYLVDNDKYPQGLLIKQISNDDFIYDNETNIYSISLNHLDVSVKDAYVPLRIDILYGDNTQTYYYVFKVKSTVDVKEAVYAYDSGVEYITSENNEFSKELEGEFGNITLHPNETRFNYEFVNKEDAEELKYSYAVQSVTLDDGRILTSQTDWEEYVVVGFDSTGVMRGTIKTAGQGQKLTLKIARVYDGGSNGLAVIGSNGVFKQEYIFVINGQVNYFLRYENQNSSGELVVQENNNATWKIETVTNGWNENQYTTVLYNLINDPEAQTFTYYLRNLNMQYYKLDEETKIYNNQGGGGSETLGEIIYVSKQSLDSASGEYYSLDSSRYIKISEVAIESNIVNNIDDINVLYFEDVALIYADANGNVNQPYEFVYPGTIIEYNNVSEEGDYYKIAENQYVKKSSNIHIVSAKKFNKDLTTVYKKDSSGYIDSNKKLIEDYIEISSYNLQVTLMISDGSTGTPVATGLKANFWVDEGDITDIISMAEYDEKSKTLTITPKSYLEKDGIVHCSFYTDYGYLGDLTIEVGASASVVVNETSTTAGTKELNIKDLLSEVKYKGQSVENYDVASVVVNSEDDQFNNYIIVNNNEEGFVESLTFIPSVKDFSVDFTITLKFNDTDTYTFDIKDFEVKTNIYQKDSTTEKVGLIETTAQIISGESLVAGQARIISADELYDFIGTGNINNIRFTYQSNATDVIASQTEEVEILSFIPEIEKVPNDGVDVRLTIKISFTENGVTQSFYVKYDIKILCAGKVEVNYPVPQEGIKLEAEYLEKDAEFTTAQDFFFNSEATFANANRVVLSNTDETSANDSNAQIKIVEMGNIDILQGGTHKDTSSNSNTISLTDGLKFVIGNWNEEKSDNINNGEESYVIFQITYNGYVENYKVILQETVYSLDFNMVTNSVVSGGDNKEVENFYVENLVSDAKILQNDRLISYTLNNSVAEGTYKFEFTKIGSANANIEIEFYVNSADARKTKIIDAGTSLEGYSFSAIYRIKSDSSIEKLESYNELLTSEPVLTERVIMYYNAGSQKIQIDYSKVSAGLSFLDNSGELSDSSEETTTAESSEATKLTLDNYTIKTGTNALNQEVSLNTFVFALGNGQSLSTKSFANSFTYQLALDIEADSYSHDSTFIVENLEAYEEYQLVERVGLRKQSTNQLMTQDLYEDGAYLTFTQIPGDSAADKEFLKNFYNYINGTTSNPDETAFENFFKLAPDSNTNNYMAYSINLRDTENERTGYDIRVWGLGAPLGGVYNVGKLTYNVNVKVEEDKEIIYSQSFYVIFKVLPAYTIKVSNYNMVVENSEASESEQYLSNINNPYVAVVNNDDSYLITLDDSSNSVLQVTYTNEYNSKNQVNFFDKTVTVGEEVQQVIYNDETNIDNKKLLNGWTKNESESTVYYEKSKGSGIELKPTEVIFADQKYRMKLVDDYGYYFYFYFTLKASNTTPDVATSGLEIREGEAFDITSKSTVLSIAGVDESKNLKIQASSNPAPTGTDIKSIELSGFNFHFFDKDYASSDNAEYLEWNLNSNKYISSNTEKYKIPTEFENFMSPSNYQNITISQIQVGFEGIAEKTVITTTSMKIAVGTDDNSLTFNGVAEKISDSLKMPVIATNLDWEDSGIISATMYITLRYDPDASTTDSTNEEYYTLSVPFTLQRAVQIKANKTAVREGELFTLSQYITAEGTTQKISSYEFVNDTLEVFVPDGESVSFRIWTVRSGDSTNATSKEITTPSSHTQNQIHRYSISKETGRTLAKGDEIHVIVTKSSETQFTIGDKQYTGYAFNYYTDSSKGDEDFHSYDDDIIKVYVPAESSLTFKIWREWTENNESKVVEEKTISINNEEKTLGIYNYLPGWLLYGNANSEEKYDIQQNFYIQVTECSSTSFELDNLPYTGYAIKYNNQTYGSSLDKIDLELADDFATASVITNDIINVSHVDHFNKGEKIAVEKYYVLNLTIANTSTAVSYRYAQTYDVEWTYSSAEQKNHNKVSASGGENGPYTIEFEDIISNLVFKDTSGEIIETSSENPIDPKSFKLEVTEAGSGNARVAEDGTITTGTGFNIEGEYITLVFYRKVSGFDGIFGTADDVYESTPFFTYRFQIYNSSQSST